MGALRRGGLEGQARETLPVLEAGTAGDGPSAAGEAADASGSEPRPVYGPGEEPRPREGEPTASSHGELL